jgi:hypothetical protein
MRIQYLDFSNSMFHSLTETSNYELINKDGIKTYFIESFLQFFQRLDYFIVINVNIRTY